MLSWLYREEYTHGFNLQPDPLGRALAAARRALDVAPSNHLAHAALASALFFHGEFGAFRTAAERSLALNSMDGLTGAYISDFRSDTPATGTAVALSRNEPSNLIRIIPDGSGFHCSSTLTASVTTGVRST
jgi:hypothetical protein